ncbi:type I polyketide synthase [Candidatus Uabimicrobium amorphum]|uniref:Polyketide synthase n=1 Tax=Uabimicrobium amorphum TaxID=2596890 RepID=A0A5S9F3D5_UABAM|nr:type I polyketide synthase [Candidatus Uabimicrobium amorphum]BBM84392.1 polyketide synthase [Candidatus Uabimicrobium amorphum]
MEIPVAVIGMSCRYPGAANVKELWENVLAKRQHFRKFPEKRMPVASYCNDNPQVEDTTSLDMAAFIDNWSLDLTKWRIPQQTYESTDPVHWLALDLAEQALRRINIQDQKLREKTAVYIGNTLTGEFTRARSLRLRWPFVERVIFEEMRKQDIDEQQQQLLLQNIKKSFKGFFPPTNEDTLAGSLSNTIAGRICNFFGFGGGGYTIDGACASSLLAVATAVEKLANGELDMAIAGGIDISLDPFEMVGFSKAGALATSRLAIYDQRACGMMPGEGAGIVILKRLPQAIRDNDNIYAIVRGWGVSSDGEGAITAPKVGGQVRALSSAWQRANYHDIDFVEGHGTGTTLGDRVELESIHTALQGIRNHTERNCGVTSLKSIIGHTKAAAGIGAFIKTVAAVNQRVLPPFAGCENPHNIFRKEARNLYPLCNAYSRDEPIKAGVSAMGFGGINAHIALESPDKKSTEFTIEKSLDFYNAHTQDAEVFVFSASSQQNLYKKCEELYLQAQQIAQCELADLSAFLFTNVNKQYKERLAIIASTPKELAKTLKDVLEFLRNEAQLPHNAFFGNTTQKPRIGFMFAGQGSQKIAMAHKLFMRTDDKKQLLQVLQNALGEKNFNTWIKALYPDDTAMIDHRDSYSSILKQTKFAQPAICFAALLHLRLLTKLGIQPHVVCGHSLGELAALHTAGAFGEKQLLEIAANRGIAMSGEHSNDGMLSLGTDSEHAQQIITKAQCQSQDPLQQNYAVIANKNHAQQTVIAGHHHALRCIKDISPVNAIVLPVSRAFHSKLVEPCAAQFGNMCAISGSMCTTPNNATNLDVDFISGVDGELHRDINSCEYLQHQIPAQVDFVSLLNKAMDRCDILLELGGGQVLSNIAAKIRSEHLCLPIEAKAGTSYDICKIVATLFTKGVTINSQVLFHNRIIHPYVAPQKRKFLINPCEQDANSKYKPQQTTTAKQQVITSAKQPLLSLRERIAALTGFPLETIHAQHRLLDDLNLDSIKSAEVISVFSQQFQLQQSFEPTAFTNATLDELSQQVCALKQATKKSSWVHSFVRKWRQKEITDKEMVKANYRLVGDTSGRLASILSKSFAIDSHATSAIFVLPEDTTLDISLLQKLANSSSIKHITVLDPNSQRNIKRDEGVESFFASLQREIRDFGVNFIGISHDFPMECIPQLVTKEHSHNQHHFSSVYYNKRQQRLTPHWQLIFPDTKNQLPLPQHVVVVSGGAKGITAECVIELAQKCAATFVLLGSSPREKVSLEPFAAFGDRIHYFSCDITDASQVNTVMKNVQTSIGEIEWIIHGAGINIPRKAAEVSLQQAQHEIAPKLLGLDNLLQHSAHTKQVIAFTSVIGVTGLAGNAWYAFANESLRRKLAKWQANNPDRKSCAFAFSAWEEVGMAANLGTISHLDSQGIKAIPLKHGVDQFMKWISTNQKPDEVIICSEMGKNFTPLSLPETTPKKCFIDNIVNYTPQINLSAQYTLDVQHDEYLNDHIFDGKKLFPTVFGLEAMAQGVEYLWQQNIAHIRFSDVKLTYPIVVNHKLNIRIDIKRKNNKIFNCCIRCEDSNYDVVHFSATVIVNNGMKNNFAQIPQQRYIEDAKKLYGPILFQGTLFQQIEQVCDLSRQQCTAKIANGPHSDKWYCHHENFTLGNPYQRDALLQMGQLIITPALGLPIAIDKIDIDLKNSNRVYAQTQLRGQEQNNVMGDVVVSDATGNVVEELRGYQIRIVQQQTQMPYPEKLAEYLQSQNHKPLQMPAKANDKIFTVEDHERGERGEVNFLYRFPMRFAYLGNPSGGTHFATYLHWIGETREVGIRKNGIYEKATQYISSQNYAWITKETKLQIIDTPQQDSFIEVECWNERLYGTQDASLEMIYRFYACNDNVRRPIAEIAQTTTWAKVIDHGVVKPVAYPQDMHSWILQTLPQQGHRRDLSWTTDWEKGQSQLIAAQGPQLGKLLFEESFRTTPRHSNFVGNIYWSNYADWMGEVRDLWLQSFMNYGEAELRCTNCHIQHLREAMPGDVIVVKMYLQHCYEYCLDLQFNFYKSVDGELQKLATASHTAYSFILQKGKWVPSSFSHFILQATL